MFEHIMVPLALLAAPLAIRQVVVFDPSQFEARKLVSRLLMIFVFGYLTVRAWLNLHGGVGFPLQMTGFGVAGLACLALLGRRAWWVLHRNDI